MCDPAPRAGAKTELHLRDVDIGTSLHRSFIGHELRAALSLCDRCRIQCASCFSAFVGVSRFSLTKQWSLAALMDETGHRIAFVHGYSLEPDGQFFKWADGYEKTLRTLPSRLQYPAPPHRSFRPHSIARLSSKTKWFDRNGSHSRALTCWRAAQGELKRAQ